jgi:hypothetical protein
MPEPSLRVEESFMSESELSRLRRDVDVIQEAAGLNLPFGWRDVWLALGLVPCGIVIVLWTLLGPWDYIFVSLAPLGLLALVAVSFLVIQYQQAGKSRTLRHESVATALAVLGFALLILWEKWLSLPAMPVRGAAFIIAGVLCLVIAVTNRQRRASLAVTVALVPFGISLPLCSQQQVALIGGIAVAAAGIVVAGILAAQLRTAKQV